MMKTSPPFSTSVVIAAAGSSRRMKDAGNKQFLYLAGMPVLAHTLLAFSNLPEISEIIVVTRQEDILLVQDMIREFSIGKVKAVLPGGASRQESVYRGLLEVSGDRVLIHDGARPFVDAKDIRRVLSALESSRAAALGVTPKDTIKEVDKNGVVVNTLPREALRQIQTPQGFYTAELLAGHQKAAEDGIAVTDDCALAEYIGIPVQIVEGNYRNIKITTPEDLPLAEALQNAK